MWLSLSWLRDFVDLGDRTPERIAEDLTMRTALIEGIERRGEFSDDVVIGKVLEKRRHPDADRLSHCVVDVGTDTVEVVCGAPNVAVGQTVAVARVGAVLPGDFKIKRSKIRGVISNGMICSEDELQLGEDHDGIMVLEEGLEIGQPFRDVVNVRDVLLEIDNKSITHRPDLWGHEGFGRELAAIYQLDFSIVALDETLRDGRGPLEVRIEAKDLCGRYYALFVSGPLGGDSPGWMRRRLAHCGLRPLSLGVDVSNYVMLEIGQPNHPFDQRRIAGGVIRIRRAEEGERLVTLDGIEREMPEGACMIADAERAIAVGGIVGGEASGITADTTDAIIESASFDPVSVRATSTALGLRTDALTRFEKALDPALAERGVRRYATLLREVAPDARVAAEWVRDGEGVQAPIELRLRPERAAMKLGVELDRAEVSENLTRLGFGLRDDGQDFMVEVPSFRATRDIECEDDLIEEVGRIQGYDRIPDQLPEVSCRPVQLEPVNDAWRSCVRLFSGRLGFAEVASYPYVDDGVLERAGGAGEGPYLTIRNPLQQTARRLRRSQVPWLLEFVDRNIRSSEQVRLFEGGRVFLPRTDVSELPYEPLFLSAVWGERVLRRRGGEKLEGAVLRALKGCLEEMGETLSRPLRFQRGESTLSAWIHPVRSAAVFAGTLEVGMIGQVHPDIATRFGWRGEVAAFEIDLTGTLEASVDAVRYEAPPRFPPVRVDISFLAPFDRRYDEIRDGLLASADRLSLVDLVDEYTAGDLGDGMRSLTLRLTFRDPERTLDDDDISTQMGLVKDWLASQDLRVRG